MLSITSATASISTPAIAPTTSVTVKCEANLKLGFALIPRPRALVQAQEAHENVDAHHPIRPMEIATPHQPHHVVTLEELT